MLSPLMELGAKVYKAYHEGTLTEPMFVAALDEYVKLNTTPDALDTFLQYGEREWVERWLTTHPHTLEMA